MMIAIADFLSGDEVLRLRSIAAQGVFADGRETAGWHARLVKQNEQLAGGAMLDEAQGIVRRAADRNGLFRSAGLPARLSPILVSRYAPGMTYGPHVDDALMGRGSERVRTDLACTVFLSALEDYEGGSLVVMSPAGEHSVRLAPGQAVLYPATSLHSVEPVRSGERLAAVFWVQSLVREAEKREMLFDLERARQAVFQREGKSETFDLLSKSYSNLLRMWAEN
ncbi:MAG: Fe2+-dependent dioxygenase [Alphaproteobacteria bacterium]|nr:Fe2+-dependent dioxygenase [Alphaproteobacteria bacterium]